MKMKTRKTYGTLLLFLSLTLVGCSNDQIKVNESPESDDGYKPVIMYNNNLYWLSAEKAPTVLPDGFVDSSQKIEACIEDPMQLPKENLITSLKNCGGVGKSIFINKADDSKIIIITEMGQYQVFEKN